MQGKELGIDDYLLRYPTSRPTPISEQDEQFVIASVRKKGMLLGFDEAMRKPQLNSHREQFISDNLQIVRLDQESGFKAKNEKSSAKNIMQV